ncbi:DUF58 domain-containing protein [Cohnella abietis]|uniref:DUF58 domain-containing protein n=1 Tax=Cohnella abietis TaxID=2507935 RepID=A0A3T1CYZ7_9BACL|nr:DUF58 domain-containing protein [Cohnella abietis]BBI31054.1 hypothetical protein KCTCHS21_04530 [Cohnella abietis]
MAVLIWAVLILFLIYLIQRLVYRVSGFKSISYDRKFSTLRIFAGQTMWMQETIANRKRIPLPWLRVESLLPAQLVFKHQESHMSINRGDQLQNHASLFSIPPLTEIVRKHEILCPHRGKYRIASYTLSLGDIIGGPSRTIQLPADCKVIVYPKVKELRDFPLDTRKYIQSVRSMISPIMEDHYYVAGIRPYRQGDSFRMVNWNATAKAGEILVHKRESMQDNDLMIILNAEMFDFANNRRIMPADFEEGLSYAASAIQYMVSGGGKAGMIYNGAADGNEGTLFRAPAKSGTSQLEFLLDALAGFRADVTLGLPYVLEQMISERKNGINYLLITGFIDAKEENLVKRLRQQGNTVQLLLLSREVAS